MPMSKNSLAFIILFFCLSLNLFAQQEPRLGVAIKPIIPSALFDNQSLVQKQGKVTFSIDPKVGYSAGVVLRKDLPSLLSLETGI